MENTEFVFAHQVSRKVKDAKSKRIFVSLSLAASGPRRKVDGLLEVSKRALGLFLQENTAGLDRAHLKIAYRETDHCIFVGDAP